MSTPDSAAASLPEPLWNDAPLPEVGRAVGIKYSTTIHGRTRWHTVLGKVTATQADDTKLIIQLDDDKSYLITSESLLDAWWYLDPERDDAVLAASMITSMVRDALSHHVPDEENPFGPDLSDEPTETIGEDIPTPHPQTLAARMRRLAWLDDQIKACEAEAKGYQTEYDQLCSDTIERMAEEGVPSITVDDSTWFMKSTPYVEKVDGATSEDIKKALVESGYGSLLTETYNANSLRSLLVEFRDSDGQLAVPDKLAAVVKLGERPTIGRTRAAARKRAARR